MRRAIAVLALIAGAACAQKAPAKQYQLEGQILAVEPGKQTLTIQHGDIPGFMPAMTMNYPVARPELMQGRVAGEMIKATLEVSDEDGKLVAITHVGNAPLPTNSNTAALAEGILQPGDHAPDAALIDTQNRRRSFSEWKGTPTLVTFIYTRCPLPNFCPLMDQNFAAIQRMAAADPALKGRVKLVSITFDPAHDTPAVFAAHAKKLGADPAVWTFLTGDPSVIERFAAKFGVSVMRPDTPNGYITHNLRTTLIGADGKVAKIYDGSDWTPQQAIADLRGLPR